MTLKIFEICSALALFLLIFSYSARAETYEVKIQRLGEKTHRTALCNDENDPCFITLPFPAHNGNQGYIDVGMKFDHETAYFQFMHKREYLAVTAEGNEILEVPLQKGKADEAVTLYIVYSDDSTLSIQPVVRKPGVFTQLGISIQPDEN